MADVEHATFTVTEKRTRKVKKTTKRRESGDQGTTEITEITQQHTNGEGYVPGPNHLIVSAWTYPD